MKSLTDTCEPKTEVVRNDLVLRWWLMAWYWIEERKIRFFGSSSTDLYNWYYISVLYVFCLRAEKDQCLEMPFFPARQLLQWQLQNCAPVCRQGVGTVHKLLLHSVPVTNTARTLSVQRSDLHLVKQFSVTCSLSLIP